MSLPASDSSRRFPATASTVASCAAPSSPMLFRTCGALYRFPKRSLAKSSASIFSFATTLNRRNSASSATAA